MSRCRSRNGWPGSEQRLRELPHDPGAAEAREGIVALQGRNHRTGREGVAGAVVVGDDDLDSELRGFGDLGHGGDPAVDGEYQLDAVAGELRDGLGRETISLVEPRGKMPLGVGAELAEQEDGKRRRADSVGVVVAVDADPLPCADGFSDAVDRAGHVAERERLVAGQRALEEGLRFGGVAVAAPNEHRCERGADSERVGKLASLDGTAVGDRPGSLVHRTIEGTEGPGRRYSFGRFTPR